MCTLVIHALRISDDNSLESGKSHLLDVFENNGYSRSQGLKAFQKVHKGMSGKSTQVDPISKVYRPFIQGTTDKISHILKRNNISASFKPLCTIRNSLRSIKKPIDPKHMKGV